MLYTTLVDFLGDFLEITGDWPATGPNQNTKGGISEGASFLATILVDRNGTVRVETTDSPRGALVTAINNIQTLQSAAPKLRGFGAMDECAAAAAHTKGAMVKAARKALTADVVAASKRASTDPAGLADALQALGDFEAAQAASKTAKTSLRSLQAALGAAYQGGEKEEIASARAALARFTVENKS